MTREQLKELFPQITQIEDLHQSRLGIASYVIDNRKFSVAFGFVKDGLASVHLIDQKTLVDVDGTEIPMLTCKTCPQAETGTSKSARKKAALAAEREAVVKTAMNAVVVTNTKDAIMDTLREKYGNPTIHTVSGDNGDTDEFKWLFPSTTISLIWFHSEYKQLDEVTIFYGPRGKSADL